MDVIRDESIVQLNQHQVRVLEVNLQATRDRFEVGDLTRTDVAQSEARLALAQGQLRIAEARLIASRGELSSAWSASARHARAAARAAPPARPTRRARSTIALDEQSRSAASPRRSARRAGYDVDVAAAAGCRAIGVVGRAELLQLSRFAGDAPAPPVSATPASDRAGGVGLTLPLYQGGASRRAQVRQAQARRGQVIEQVIGDRARGDRADALGLCQLAVVAAR